MARMGDSTTVNGDETGNSPPKQSNASPEASTPLLDDLDKDGRLLMMRLLLSQKLGKEKTIWLAWGQKSGGRNHDKYRYFSDILEMMLRELNQLGFNEENNWGIGGN